MRLSKYSGLIFGLLILFFNGTRSAYGEPRFDGFFVDVGAGYRNITTSSSSAVTFRGNSIPYSMSSSTPNNAVVVASAGYNFAITPGHYLGVGANASPANGLAQQTSIVALNKTFTVTGIKPIYNYGIFVTPSMLFGSGLMYIKAGSQTTVVNSSAGSSFRGYMLGLGYRQPIYESIYAFGEFDYLKYQSQIISRRIVNAGGSINASVTTAPQNIRFLLGIGYQF